MSLDTVAGTPVHYPADPKKFEFDSEVSKVFPDMAVRSIPNFLEAHAAHADMLAPWFSGNECRILDVGASRGHFVSALKQRYPDHFINQQIKVHAVDNSASMCAMLQEDHPDVMVSCKDVGSESFLQGLGKYDVVCAHYVLQFLPVDKQIPTLRSLLRLVRHGGVFILGHKSRHEDVGGMLAHEQYIKFRLDRGYTREEIAAKTLALRGSMFPMDHEEVLLNVSAHCDQIVETFRFMMFSTLFAIK